MKKILFVLSSEKLSGGERVALDIAYNLKEEFEFIFCLPKEPSKEFKELLKSFKLFYSQNSKILEVSKKIGEIIKKESPEIIVAHGTRASIYLKIFLLKSLIFKRNFKFIYILHGIHFIRYKFPKNFIFYLWEVVTNRFLVDYLICVGKDDFELAKKLKLNKNIVLIENGINYKDYENIRLGILKKEFDLKEDTIVLTTICRLHYQKDIVTLIKAINLLKNENTVLFVVGDGPDRKKLEDLTKKLNLENKIKFLGYRTDIKEILADTDIFILSSKWEGLPIVILEAWASKKPVIASNVHGIKSLVEDNKDGLLFEFKNEKDLVQKINFLIKNEEAKSMLAENGYNKVKKFYNLEIMVNNYEDLFSQCLK
ncbi:MAG: hypothetical protein KatS3mg095_1010 [Candidatus Parcubacteria bacterium]|nr:MAG: hypothetical protein KatS3mg095_1010 [Candidatus Parcubacteria bacterium]